MQQNSGQFPSKLTRSSENAMQPTTKSSSQFPRAPINPRFAITPEAIGMNFRSESPATSRIHQSQHKTPVIDVKSCYDRHSRNPLEPFADSKQESSAPYQSSQTNMPTYSLRGANAGHCLSFDPSNKVDLMTQSPSPISSPQTPQQQWNFEHSTTNSEGLQLTAEVAADNYNVLQVLNCDEQTSKIGDQSLGNTSVAAHEQGVYFQNASRISETHDFCSNVSAKLNFKSINGKYAQRIEDIDANAWGDKDLKIFTYREWVELLININESFLTSMEELEREVAGRLDLMQRRANSSCRHSQGNELMKCRKDIFTLLQYIKNINSNKNWDLALETLTADEVLRVLDSDNSTAKDNGGDEIKNYADTDGGVQRNKLYANMKALAQEVAEKHDEVRELKRQVICLEDEIQKAQKKIQLKDDVIKELRSDLKCVNNKLSSNPLLETSLAMLPANFENQISCSANTQIRDNISTVDNGSQFDSLSHSELEEHGKIKILQEEMSDFFEISDLNKQKNEQYHQKIKEVIAKAISEKQNAYRKLDFIRQQLIDLECDSNEGRSDCDSGFRSNSENDQNARLLDAIRQRLRKRNETICELRKKVQKLEMDNNELSTRLETEMSHSVRSSHILKEVADLLCELRGKQFSYTAIYSPTSIQMNPFCEAIIEMQNDFKQKEAQLLQVVNARNKEKEELTQLLWQKGNEFNQEGVLRPDTNKAPVALLPCTPSPSPLPPPQLSPTLATTVTKPSPTSHTAEQSDNIPATTSQ